MIQGLRCLPFTADLPIFDCHTCRNGKKRGNQVILQPQSIVARRAQACGFLTRDTSVKAPWGLPIGLDFVPGLGEQGTPDFVPICPGYLTGLPEVQEAVRYRPQWLKGQFPSALSGDDLATDMEPSLDAQAVLEGAVTTYQNWKIEHDAKERSKPHG